MKVQDSEKEILKLIEETNSIIPSEFLQNLEIDPETKQHEWHSFEDKIWQLGEKIRQLLLNDKNLKNKEYLFDKLLIIATNRNAKRGRQSFILLFGGVKYAKYSKNIIEQLNDGFVDGHVIDTIYKMKVDKYTKEILPFCNNKFTWIRNIAKKYVEKYEV